MKADIVIVGAGIVGSTIARELSKYKIDVAVVEKEADIAFGSPTKANSGIVHAGYDDEPGTIKAEHSSRGNAMWHRIVGEVNAPFKETGSLVVALKEEEMGVLTELKSRGEKNGVPELEIVEDRERLLEMEPHLNREAVAALYAPTAAVTSPYELAISMMENAVQNGVKVSFGTEVTGISVGGGRVKGVQTNRGEIETGYVVNAAGLSADRISSMAGLGHFTIHPRKGEYCVLDKKAGDIVRHVVFPTPTPVSKGIVVAPTVEDNVLIGPNAQDIEDKEDVTTTFDGLVEVFAGASRLIPALEGRRHMIITNFCGLRPEPDTGDFVVGAYDEVRGFINVAGMKSPGLTTAPSVALKVAELLGESGLELRHKERFDNRRKPIARPLRGMDPVAAQDLIDRDSRYGHVVCRCEHVTEAEVLEAINRGASTLDGVKFRTRAGMGRCQGGFCTPHILRILAEKLGTQEENITKRGGGSRLFLCRTKELLLRGDLHD